jgi:dolichol-phosphate mannosyltransferase
MSGFFFLKKEVIDNVMLSPKGFKIGLEILVRGNYNKVIEVPDNIPRQAIWGEQTKQ